MAPTEDQNSNVEAVMSSDKPVVDSEVKNNSCVEQVDAETYTIDPAAERRLVRKFDFRILPLLTGKPEKNKPIAFEAVC